MGGIGMCWAVGSWAVEVVSGVKKENTISLYD